MHIRSFQNHDRAPLSELFLNTRKLSWPWLDSSKWGLSDFEKYTENEMILVAKKDQEYLGFASIYLQENFLHHLFIAPNAQNQGAGTALLHTAEQLFTGTVISNVYLKINKLCLFIQVMAGKQSALE